MPHFQPNFSTLQDLCQAQSIWSRLSPQQRTWKIHVTRKFWSKCSCHSTSYSLILSHKTHFWCVTPFNLKSYRQITKSQNLRNFLQNFSSDPADENKTKKHKWDILWRPSPRSSNRKMSLRGQYTNNWKNALETSHITTQITTLMTT